LFGFIASEAVIIGAAPASIIAIASANPAYTHYSLSEKTPLLDAMALRLSAK